MTPWAKQCSLRGSLVASNIGEAAASYVACAFTEGSLALPTAEDALLDATRSAMADGDWGVGCNTTRNNA